MSSAYLDPLTIFQPISKSNLVCQQSLAAAFPNPTYLRPQIPAQIISCTFGCPSPKQLSSGDLLLLNICIVKSVVHLAVLHQTNFPQVRERVQCAQLPPRPPAHRAHQRRLRRPPPRCMVWLPKFLPLNPLSNHPHFGGLFVEGI